MARVARMAVISACPLELSRDFKSNRGPIAPFLNRSLELHGVVHLRIWSPPVHGPHTSRSRTRRSCIRHLIRVWAQQLRAANLSVPQRR